MTGPASASRASSRGAYTRISDGGYRPRICRATVFSTPRPPGPGRPASPGSGTRRRCGRRELDIAREIARGRTNREIAAELFISLSTVKTHIARIQAKLGARNRVEIATWSRENRIMER